MKSVFLSGALAALACGESDPCGAGMVDNGGSCVAAAGAGGAGTAGSSGSGASAGSGTGGAAGAPADFGAGCSVRADCGGNTDYCAVQPGQPGYCTVSGCDADMSLCPTDWTCFNVGQFAPGEPWVCIKP